MAKITLNGEHFDFDGSKHPMSEALAVEKAWGRRYAEFESELAAGSAEAFCVLAWLVWRRDGRDIELKDILSGDVDFDVYEFAGSIAAASEEDAAEADPTIPAAPRTGLAGTATTQRSTKRSSPKSST